MRVPVRIVGLASTFCWVFLVGFCVSAVYSFRDVRFDFGKLQMDVTADGMMVFSLPLTVANKGYYDIGCFNLTTQTLDDSGFLIARESTFVPVVERGREFAVSHNMTVNISDLLRRDEGYLFNDTELKVHAIVSMRITEVFPVEVSTNFSLPWGGPIQNLTLGEIEYGECNGTHTRIVVPFEFKNHAFFNLTGIARINMYNSAGVFLGEKQVAVDAVQRSGFRRSVELYVLTSDLTGSGRFEVYFSTSLFDCGPLVIPYG